MYKKAAGRVNLLLRICANIDIFSAEEQNNDNANFHLLWRKHAWWYETRRCQIRNQKQRKDDSAQLQMSKL